MLEPDSRVVLLDQLRPPPGYRLHAALDPNAPFFRMLQPYRPGTPVPVDPEDERLRALLNGLRTLAEIAFTLTCSLQRLTASITCNWPATPRSPCDQATS